MRTRKQKYYDIHDNHGEYILIQHFNYTGIWDIASSNNIFNLICPMYTTDHNFWRFWQVTLHNDKPENKSVKYDQ